MFVYSLYEFTQRYRKEKEMVKTTTAINFKDLPKEIKECLGSAHDKMKTKVQMSDFTKFPDVESFSEDLFIKAKQLVCIDSEFSLAQEISGTRKECHVKLDKFLNTLESKIIDENPTNITFSFSVETTGYDLYDEYTYIDYVAPETQEEYQERQDKIAKAKKLQEFLPEFKKMLDEENKKNEYELESAYQKELEAVKKKFGKL